MNSIAAEQYSENSNVYKKLTRLLPAPMTALCSPTWAALQGAEVGEAAWVWRSPLFWRVLCGSVSGEH